MPPELKPPANPPTHTVGPLTLGIFSGALLLLPYWYGGQGVHLWGALLVALLGGGVGVGLALLASQTVSRARVRFSLSGRVREAPLEEISQQYAPLAFEPGHRAVTLLWVEWMGFEEQAERLSPQDSFRWLRTTTERIAQAVGAQGGVLDVPRGQGVGAVFGYSPHTGKEMEGHADSAVRAAEAILRSHLDANLEAEDKGGMVLPLRVTVHSCPVHMGDLGIGDRIDWVAIGPGHGWIRRWTASGEPDRVLLSPTAKDLLKGDPQRPLFLRKKELPPKDGRGEPEIAYEWNPNLDRPEALEKVEAAFRRGQQLVRLEPRWPVPQSARLLVTSGQGSGRLINFSKGGLGVAMDRYLGRGTQLSLAISSDHGAIAAELNDRGLLPLTAVVRWSHPVGGGEFWTGFQFQHLSAQEQEALCEILRRNLGEERKAA